MSKIRVALGLSGGVDSAVSAYLLKKQGFDVSGVYLHCFDDDAPGCRGKQDRKDALAVAIQLGLPFRALDFRQAYQAAVIDYFKKEYLLGRTPNPDVICNRDIKFGLFLDWAVKAGFDYVATGHYADGPDFSEGKIAGTPASAEKRATSRERIVREVGEWQAKAGATILRIPKDKHKDQTYFLWAVPKEKFKRVLFPLGNLLKSEVREIAKDAGLGVADKKDSTGICFVGEVRVEDFLKRLGVKEKIGEVVIQPQKVRPFVAVGSHRGVWFYTIGQRHGFEINRLTGQQAKKQSSSDRPPLYVIEKDIKKNRLIVGFGAETYRDQFTVSQVNWLAELPITNYQLPITVRIRHGGELIPCSVIGSQFSVISPKSIGYPPAGAWSSSDWRAGQSAGSGQINRQPTNRKPKTDNRKQITVFLSSPQRGIAPGQSAVFYDRNGLVLGGGVIQ